MVDVVVAAVDIGQPVDLTAAGAPHLRHVDVGQRGGTDADAADGVPHDALAMERLLDVLRHLVDEGRRCAGLVGAHVDVGSQGEGCGQLREQCFQGCAALVAAHGVTHRIGEGGGVAGHVNLRNDDDATLGGVGFQLGALRLGVVASREACHVGGLVELRIDLRLEAEALVVGHVPMEYIDLEACEQVDFLLQFVETDE